MTKPGLLNIILRAGIMAGVLDIMAAIFLLAKGNALGTLKFIASGVFGKAAFEGGAGMVLLGAVFHFSIALIFAAGYFMAYPQFPFLRKNKWINGIGFGLLVWSIMNLLVLPLSRAPQSPFAWQSALLNMAILIVCIGMPVALLADRFYSTQTRENE